MTWWRHSQYELRDNRICPKPKARLMSYHPWADYESGKRRPGESPPYLSLLNLLDEIRPEVRPESSGSPPFIDDMRSMVRWSFREPLPAVTQWAQQSVHGRITALSQKAPPAMSERAIRRVLEWTDCHGLLGILPQRLLLLQGRTLPG